MDGIERRGLRSLDRGRGGGDVASNIMLAVVDRTPFSSSLIPALDKDGTEYLVVVTKATFSIHTSRGAVVADEQVPVALADVHHGEPGRSSILYESDSALRKPGADVVLVGKAHGPAGGASSMEIELRVGAARRVVRVLGPRVWSRIGATLRASQPGRITTVPLVWERAFGGADERGRDERNPVGTGYVSPGASGDLEGQALPQLEDPSEPLQQLGERPRPVGFGFVSRSWSPRTALAGTYDAAWRAERAPLLPLDFDDRFFLGAPSGLSLARLDGGEQVAARGVLPGAGAFEFVVPRRAIEVRIEMGAAATPHRARLDTMVVEPERRRILLTYRASVPVRRRLLDIDRVRITEVSA